jgi:phosphoglycolate phosphatase
MNTKVTVWDFDGVFVNTFDLGLSIMQTTYPALTQKEFRSWFEGNVNEAKAGKPIPSDPEFFAEYEPKILNLSPILGIDNALKQISSSYPCVIVSATTNEPIKKYLQTYALDSYIHTILGNDVSPSKVEKLEMALQEFRTKPSNCVFITDTLGDIKEAKEVGMHTIAVTWGFHSEKILLQGKPTALIKKTADLPATIERILS